MADTMGNRLKNIAAWLVLLTLGGSFTFLVVWVLVRELFKVTWEGVVGAVPALAVIVCIWMLFNWSVKRLFP